MNILFSRKNIFLALVVSLLFILGSTKAFAGKEPTCDGGNDPSTITCQNGVDSDCLESGCPSCVHCNTTTKFCEPVDSDCQDISGGSVENTCRTAQCVDFKNIFNGNLTGCDYEPISSSQNEDCINCSPYQANPNCGNGSCEQPDETFANCPIDCQAPGWVGPKLNPGNATLDGACLVPPGITFFTFSGPPYNDSNSGFCEDGDICTSNACNFNTGICVVTAKGCNTTADGCCPDGCNPPANGKTCPVNTVAATTCDPDCRPPVDCIPTPTPPPPPPPPLSAPCLQGSGMGNNSGNLPGDCTGFTGCSLNQHATSASNQGFLMLTLVALSLGLWMKLRKRSN